MFDPARVTIGTIKQIIDAGRGVQPLDQIVTEQSKIGKHDLFAPVVHVCKPRAYILELRGEEKHLVT